MDYELDNYYVTLLFNKEPIYKGVEKKPSPFYSLILEGQFHIFTRILNLDQKIKMENMGLI